MRNRVGAERGWGPTSRAEFRARDRGGSLLRPGSPETVARKIAATLARCSPASNLKYSAGTLRTS